MVVPLVLLLLSGGTLERCFADNTKQSKSVEVAWGAEADLLPFATGGYGVQLWYGKDKKRLRGVIAKVNVPDSFIKDDFKDKTTTAYALILDIFFKEGFEGYWVGTGFEQWKNSIKHKTASGEATFTDTLFTFGGGYIYSLNSNVYINPWVATHYILGDKKSVTLGGFNLDRPTSLFSASLKIGYRF